MEVDEKVIRGLEINANKYTIQFLLFSVILFTITWLMDMVGIFIVDKSLMNMGFFGILIVVGIAIAVCKTKGIEGSWVKYFLLTVVVAITTISGIVLSYHTVFLFALPLLYSAQYGRKSVIFASVANSIGIFISTMVGYYYGLCDANMVLLTVNRRSYYVNDATGTLQNISVNENPWVTLPLYYVLPRILLMLVMVPIVVHISDSIIKKAEREAKFKYISERDELTRLYNRNKYKDMDRHRYQHLDHVGVLFWDVNGLKKTNDSFGHEYGDLLIKEVANIIRELTNDSAKAYRMGGDEFALVIENADEEEVHNYVVKWQNLIADRNSKRNNKISAAVGWACGSGSNLKEIFRKADAAMYEDKSERRI